MADPFGIVGVIGVATQIFQVLNSFAREWKDAPAEVNGFLNELHALKTCLSEIYTNLILSKDFKEAFQDERSALLAELGDANQTTDTSILIASCQTELSELLVKLKGRATGHRLGWKRIKSALLAKKVREAVNNLDRRCQTLNRLVAIDSIKLATMTLKAQREVQEVLIAQNEAEKQNVILQWLTRIDYSDKHQYHISRRASGTGDWFLQSSQFKRWIQSAGQTMFCHGGPGVGKTILTSIAIDHLKSIFPKAEKIGIAYIYCNYQRQREQRVEDLLSSLLKQLAKGLRPMPNCLTALFETCDARHKLPILEEILDVLFTVVSRYSQVFIFVDALDECQAGSRCPKDLLKVLFQLQTESHTNIFATSKDLPEIQDQFANSLTMSIKATEQDLQKYVDAQIKNLQLCVQESPELQQLIKQKLTKSAHGMFLLVVLQMDALAPEGTKGNIKNVLNNFSNRPGAYDRAYGDMMKRIMGQTPEHGELAKQILAWIVCAKEELAMSALQRALAVKTHHLELDEDYIPRMEDVVSSCAGLVVFDKESGIVRLVHKTAHEYLERTQQDWFPNLEIYITKICFTYLSSKSFDREFYRKRVLIPARGHCESLLDNYVARNWVFHARHAIAIEASLVSNFLDSEAETVRQCLLWAARNQHEEIAEWLVLQNVEVNTYDIDWKTPLHHAVRNGWKRCVELLMLHGAKITTDIENMTPLHYTVQTSNKDIAQILLDSGVSVDVPVCRDIWINERQLGNTIDNGKATNDPGFCHTKQSPQHGLTALHYAVVTGRPEMTKLFLELKADPNVVSNYGESALHLAVKRDLHSPAPLIGNGDEWNDPDQRIEVIMDITDFEDDEEYERSRALVEKDRVAVLDILLGHPEIDLTTQDIFGASILHRVRYGERGSSTIVQKLVEKNADASARNPAGQTPLHLAVLSQDVDSAKFLISHGVDIMARDNEGCTTLHYAAKTMGRDIIELLFNEDKSSSKDDLAHSHATAKDMHNRNVFHHMLGDSDSWQVKPSDLDFLLLSTKNDGADDLDNCGNSPLAVYLAGSADFLSKKDSIVRELLKIGANPSLVNQKGLSLCHLAAKTPKVSAKLLTVLEDYGVDMQRLDAEGRTALHHCAISGSLTEDAMNFFSSRGFRVDLCDNLGKTPLQHATEMSLEYHHINIYDRGRWSRTEDILRKNT